MRRLSKVESERLARFKRRTDTTNERFEPRHPQREANEEMGLVGRRSMHSVVRWRNKRETGRYGG